MFPDSSWCNVHEAEVKGNPSLDGNHTTSLSISCSVFSWNVCREKERENDDMAEWVSIAQKTNSGIDGDTGKHLISRPPFKPSHVLRPPLAYIFLQKKGDMFLYKSLIIHFFVTRNQTPSSNLNSPNMKTDCWIYCVSVSDPYPLSLTHCQLCTILFTVLHHIVICGASLGCCQWLSPHALGSSDICMPYALCPAFEACTHHQWKKNRIPLWSCNSDI